MTGQRIGIVELLQARSDRAVRKARRRRDGRDSAASQSPCLDRRPAPPAPLVQVIEHFDILDADSFYDCCILHPAVMTSNRQLTQAHFR